ncbi:hypothetical protein QJS10_CPA08g00773 [Acorus calamus]|uniref:Uncharacterized protein n=1 Tax=Acorus calamus TaxID=4465 RepID=A0AAV9ECI8_ACOCL|nr:hypothetical protein QJS10_CPA08g00773 [Acorus calamus]
MPEARGCQKLARPRGACCYPDRADDVSAGSGHDGALTLSGAPFQGTWARSVTEDASTDYNSSSGAARFSSWALPVSLAVTRGILVTIQTATGPLRTVAMVGFIRARCDARPGKASDASADLGFQQTAHGERRANIRIRDEPRHWGGDGAAERRKARRPGRRALDPMAAPGVAVAGKPAGWVRGRCHAPRPLSFLSRELLGADRAGVVFCFPLPARGEVRHRVNRGGGRHARSACLRPGPAPRRR